MKPRTLMKTLATTGAVALTAGALVMSAPVNEAVAAKKPMTHADGSWVTFTGTVAQASPKGFYIDYGRDTVFVEVDGWDWYNADYAALPGDKVTVSGRVDKDGFESRKLEAAFVYHHGNFTYHYANPADEEDFGYTVHPFTLDPTLSTMSVVGTVDNVKGDEFTLATGYANITVDTDTMPYDPLDDVGYQVIKSGDYVSVTGVMAPGSLDDFYDNRELVASQILSLNLKNNKDGGS